MNLESPAFSHGKSIPLQYACDGADISPPLVVSGVPEGARSLVLIVDDPDAQGKCWLHWTVWNIAPDTEEIQEGEIPPGASEGVTDFGETGYGGPCPHGGTHRYFFRLYALDTVLKIQDGARLDELETAADGHVIESAELIGVYGR